MEGSSENSTSYDYPDWHEFNMSDPVDKAEFIKEYQNAQEHDKYSVIIFYVIMFTLITAQSLLFWWKRKHKRTYELVTLLGLWLVPPIVSVHFQFWQFLAVWCFFTASTGYMLWLCTQRHIPRTTPRLVRRGVLDPVVA